MSIQVGDPCPVFSLPNQAGKSISTADFIGNKILVIYFYPKDDTPGCTKEACSFRDEHADFEGMGCQVIGISSDSIASHLQFATKYKLDFHLLADTQKTARKLFGVPGNLFGLIPGRVTYIIDRKGIVRGIYDSMRDAVGHITEAKNKVRELAAEEAVS